MVINFLTKKDIELIKRAARYIHPHPIKFIGAFFCTLSLIGIGLVEPYAFGMIVRGVIDKDWSILLRMVSLIVAAHLCGSGLTIVQTWLQASLNGNIIATVQNQIYRTILHLPVNVFDKMRVGDFMSRILGDSGSIANMITGTFLNSIIDILRIGILGVVIFRISIPLSLVILATLPCSLLISILFGKVLRTKTGILRKLNDSFMSTAQESLSAIREIKSLGLKENRIQTFSIFTMKVKNGNVILGVLNSCLSTSTDFISLLSEIVIIVIAFKLVVSGQLKIEYYIAFSSYSIQFQRALFNIARINSDIQQALVSFGRIFDILDSFGHRVEQFGRIKMIEIKRGIQICNLTFSYNDKNPVLKNISLSIPFKKTTALVGHSGAGKSSLLHLLLRFYNPQDGRIEIDGHDIRSFDERSFHKAVAAVTQDPILFNMTILENISISRPDASQYDIEKACEAAFIRDFIESLPSRYDTMVGERGVTISEGQKQRIAIARAILTNPQIMIFDEATSSLDNESQRHIRDSIELLGKNRTILVVAHRLSTVINADLIYVLQDGKIKGEGNHRTLLNENTSYQRLFKAEITTLTSVSN